ncbi:MAG TPA: alpha/beta fold hydrolase [Chloroflexota bacterium]|nr:alpha/beta fold hydrolase [Chloroflexota bacterium]
MSSLLEAPAEHPAQSYDEAYARFEALLRADSDEVDAESRSRLLGPGHRTQRVVVFFHGLSNAPRQFLKLSERFLARGYTVFIPRVPYHGYTNRMTTDLALLKVRDLVDTTAMAIDLAAGLADEVTVSGISMGGVLAVWGAQFRSVAVAAPIAPAIGLPYLPGSVTSVAFRGLGRLPNRFMWWDPRKKEQLAGPPYAYPRFSTRALSETQRLGFELLRASRRAPPRARSVWMINNAADLAVSNAASALLVKNWQAAGGGNNVHAFMFPKRLKLFHDVVDPLQPNAQPDLVHPILEQVIVDGQPPALTI